MLEIKGKYNTAICFTDEVEASAISQIIAVCNMEAFADSKIRIMPDVHAGSGCTVGTTLTIRDKAVPGMVGVDIGCGMDTVRLKETEIDFEKLDSVIRNDVPSGTSVRRTNHRFVSRIDLEKLYCSSYIDSGRASLSLGTLGGGNHFIEIDRGENGSLYLIIHSGSRSLGKDVATYYGKEGCKALRENHPGLYLPRELAYVEGDLFSDYIHDMKIVQQYAVLNRQAMIDCIMSGMGLHEDDRFTTIHNYIDTDNMILRKGAISAQSGEKILIPLNMRDGSLICVGKGNEDWNCSAPHGAGRLMARKDAKENLSLEEYQREMEGIYTTCVGYRTLDESPMAYKNGSMIKKLISPTAEILQQLKPVYNFKA